MCFAHIGGARGAAVGGRGGEREAAQEVDAGPQTVARGRRDAATGFVACEVGNMGDTERSLLVREVSDAAELRVALSRDRVAAAYQIADLDSEYGRFCRWFGAGPEGEELEAVVLLYTALSMPVVLTYGTPRGVEAIFDTFHTDVPGRMLIHMQPDHLDGVHAHFHCEDLRPMLRMGMRREDFQSGHADVGVEPLRVIDIGEIIDLYRFYPDNFFEPAQIESGHYYGVRRDGRLVSVAGIHVFSPESKVACLGNIVTHPDYRGQGLSSACTCHLCSALIEAGAEVFALNVARHNRSAVRVYRKLGFQDHNTYLQGSLQHTLAL